MRFVIPLICSIATICGAASLPVESKDLKSEMWRARLEFSSNLLGALDHKGSDHNVVVSTFGLHSALSAVLAGAEGETYSQLWKALGYDKTSLDRDSMLEVYEQTFDNITKLHGLGLDFSNLLVVDKDLSLKDGFLKAMKKNFGSGLLKESFKTDPEKGTNDINDWVKDITKGKIPKLFDQTLDSDTAAVIANAIHFKSNWYNQFDEKLNFKGNFTLKDGTVKNVTYMKIPAHKLKRARYGMSYGFNMVQIPFDEEDRLWFGIMLPTSSLPHFDCCSPFTNFIHYTHGADIDLTLPKFDIFQTHSNLKEILQGMGVKNLFDGASADLSGIDGKRDLFVTDIAHKATVTINENGAEAAAATGVVIGLESVEVPIKDAVQFVVDHPFIFSISDKVTGIDFFTGLVYDPQ